VKFPGAVFVFTITGMGAGVGVCAGAGVGTGVSFGGVGFSGAEFRAHSTPVAFWMKSSGSTLYFAMRSWLSPASTHSKNEYPASAASVSVKGQYG